MPVKPANVEVKNNAVDIMNAVRNEASPQYQAQVPVAKVGNSVAVGESILQFQWTRNEFLNALVNRIWGTWLSSRRYYNSLSMFKKGTIQLGETLEEIFTVIAKPHTYNPSVAEENVFKREIPDVRTAFHSMNYQTFYKQTIQNYDLRKAFLSWQGVEDMIASIVDAMYSAASFDENIMIRYMIARALLNGDIYTIPIGALNKANVTDTTIAIKALVNDVQNMSTDYNMAGVPTHTSIDRLYTIMTGDFIAYNDVANLSAAFNMSKAEFLGRQVMIRNFGAFTPFEQERLNLLMKDNPDYVPLTANDIAKLADVQALVVDQDWFMIFDNMDAFTEIYNAEGLYWNWFYHVWMTYSYSPFNTAVAFATNSGTVTAVSVSPSAPSIAKGGTQKFTATVTSAGIASKGVTWSITGGTSATTTIAPDGTLTIGADETATNITVTATSNQTPAVNGTATVTVTA